MIRALYSAASGMSAQQINIDNIANNLANANTVGYKSRRAQFQDLMYQTLVQPGTQSGATTLVPTGLQLGLGTRAASNEIIFAQGAFHQHQNPLDMVIQGHGFFQIKQPIGRNRLYARGFVSDECHRQLSSTPNGNFRFCRRSRFRPPRSPSTSRPMAPSATRFPGKRPRRSPGRSRSRHFQNPAGLNSLGQSLYLPTDASGAAVVGPPGGTDGVGTILQGYVEQSNVSVVDEFINLISSQRAYEANSKVVKAADDMYSQVNNLTK